MVPKNIPERPLNINANLNSFKSFINQLYQKHRMQNINNKKDQINYFRTETSENKQQTLRLKVKRKIDFYNKENLLSFLKPSFYKSKFANTYMSFRN